MPSSELSSSFVVVWAGARFRVAPSSSAAIVSLAPAGRAREPWTRDTFLTFRVISEQGGWATLETLGEDQGAHCTPPRPALRGLRLRLHVMSRALFRVTVREISHVFEDGTSLELSRGVPLEPLGRGELYRARLGALSTVVRLEPSAVGTRYLPSARRDDEPPESSLASGALRAGVPIVGRTGHVHSSGRSDVPIWAVEPRGSETLVELRARCARVRTRVPVNVVGEAPDARPRADSREDVTSPYVDVGAAVFWPGGAPAGSVATQLGLRDESEGDSEHRCFTHDLGSAADTVLCFRREDVVDVDAAASGLTTPTE